MRVRELKSRIYYQFLSVKLSRPMRVRELKFVASKFGAQKSSVAPHAGA